MKGMLLSWLPAFLGSLLLAGSPAAQGNAETIDLLENLTLKDLFDRGLRPTKVYGSPDTQVEVRDRTIEFILPSGSRFRLHFEQVRFDIGASDVVLQFVAKSRSMPIDEAYVEAVRSFEQTGGLPEKMRDAFEASRSSQTYRPLEGVGIAYRTEKDPEVRIGFIPGDPRTGWRRQLQVRLGVAAYWNSKVQDARNLRREPIKPPPGYEAVSMDPILSANQKRHVALRHPTAEQQEDTRGSLGTFSIGIVVISLISLCWYVARRLKK